MEAIFDGRRKLLECQIEQIRYIRATSGLSYAKIAKLYFGNRIDRAHIYKICRPDRNEEYKERWAEEKRKRKVGYGEGNRESADKRRKKQKKIEKQFSLQKSFNL